MSDQYDRLRDNLRTVGIWIEETRKRNDRPVQTGNASFAAAELPSGDEPTAAGPPAHKVLGVDQDASPDEVRNAARRRMAETHPDQGGDSEHFKRVQKAKQAMLNGGGQA